MVTMQDEYRYNLTGVTFPLVGCILSDQIPEATLTRFGSTTLTHVTFVLMSNVMQPRRRSACNSRLTLLKILHSRDHLSGPTHRCRYPAHLHDLDKAA